MVIPGLLAAQVSTDWPQHSKDRPQPLIVTPGRLRAPVPPPSDAIVLFDGSSLANWRSASDPKLIAKWKVSDGYMEVVGGAGNITTVREMGDVQLHVEWATPALVKGEGQERGNSGVFLMTRYELQVLDSYQNGTYPDGQAGAIYGQFPPLVNASLPPGEWQTYDVIFRRPRFDAAGKLLSPARMTVHHNGVLVQDNVQLSGPTGHYARPPYQAHPDKLPLVLQDHGDPVRYRNIWLRELQ